MSYYNAKPYLSADNQDLTSSFKSLQSFRDVCDLLEVTPKHLQYVLFEKTPRHYYHSFTILKKSGGNRKIVAPTGSLKILQEKVNTILRLVYKPSSSIHGYSLHKSIITNASVHLRKNNLLNFDLKDFFPSINFGRVRGVFRSFFGIGSDAATVLANICCYNNSLPQGAPTSPIISNMVCFNLDKQMQLLAKQNGCSYTRYADDITFSTSKREFPHHIAYTENEIVHLSQKVLKVVEDNSFKVNPIKTRLNNRFQHLEVTGITVNKKLNVKRNYIKRIRAILRCLENNTMEMAQEIFENKYTKIKNMKKKKRHPQVLKVVKGMIDYVGSVKGKQDAIYEKLALRYNRIVNKSVFKVGEEYSALWTEKIWVIELGLEDGESKEFYPDVQGTGFLLNGIGFVTNAHVVEKYKEYDLIRVNRSRYGNEFRHATVVKIDEDKDIAILKINDFENWKGFDHSLFHHVGMDIKVIGYPNFGTSDSLYTHKGEIIQYRTFKLPNVYNKVTGELGVVQERIVISARIIGGNSGGPVINMKGEVVGVATKGFEEISAGRHDDPTATSIMIKIEDVIKYANG